MRLATPILTSILAVAATIAPGRIEANPLKSLYTTIDLNACRVVKRHKDGNTWSCRGLEGYAVQIAEGDLRTFVSAGPAAASVRAATQTLGPFNSIFQGKSRRATVEWRFTRRNGRPVPYATILRYFTGSDDAKGEVLVVAKVAPKEGCHVAYVDALANPDAIALAREAADSRARTFDCKTEPAAVGASGRSPI